MDFQFDTNIFLEVLLGQEKSEICKNILFDFNRTIFLSDFTFHSIGVILIRQKKFDIFERFYSDINSNGSIISLPLNKYNQVIFFAQKYQLDFDDAIQTSIANEYNLGIITMDKDFKKVANDFNIKFI